MSDYKVVRLDRTESTNTYAKSLPSDDMTPTVVITDNQTAGRGQRGNSWESQSGRNLTFSLVLAPRFIAPAHQFELSMLVSLGIVNGLLPFVPDVSALKIKWPNDIYYGDRKLVGILIENSVGSSAIERSVIGIGINVNQTRFESDAPNPVSLGMVTGNEHDRDAVLDSVVTAILDMVDTYSDDPEVDELVWLYNNALWRNDGRPHKWHDTATDADFEATLAGVAENGVLSLKTADGAIRNYLFKEVSAVL